MHGIEKKYKPGWVATVPGAILHLQIDTLFSGTPTDERPQVFVTYLQSYEHMGTASISCVSGCECEAATVDANLPTEQASVPKHAELRVTQSSLCVLSVEVLPETTSGENKFKIIHISMRVDASSAG